MNKENELPNWPTHGPRLSAVEKAKIDHFIARLNILAHVLEHLGIHLFGRSALILEIDQLLQPINEETRPEFVQIERCITKLEKISDFFIRELTKEMESSGEDE